MSSAIKFVAGLAAVVLLVHLGHPVFAGVVISITAVQAILNK